MQKATIQLESLTCPSCIAKIEGAMKSLDGVDRETISVAFNSSKVKLNFDSEKITLKDIEKSITKMGYDVLKSIAKAV